MARKVGQGEEEEVARARLQEEKRHQPTMKRRRCRSYCYLSIRCSGAGVTGIHEPYRELNSYLLQEQCVLLRAISPACRMECCNYILLMLSWISHAIFEALAHSGNAIAARGNEGTLVE
ncbi:hypothetical protein STEG23_025213 [Scotinomys teguina]